MSQTDEPHPFVLYLESLAAPEKRGALAALRRGLGQPPGSAVEMFRYIVPWLPSGARGNQETAFYLVAALFALHPVSGRQGDMGAHLAQTRRPDEREDALERRFTALLAAHPDDLPFYLRQTISFLRSKGDIPVNWSQLLIDIQAWSHPERYVQKRWARSFWARPSRETAGAETSTESN